MESNDDFQSLSLKSFQHQASSLRSKIGPQPGDSSLLINEQVKYAKIFDFYEYGLETQAAGSSLKNKAQIRRGKLFARFFCQRIINRENKKKESSAFVYASDENVFVSIPSCFADHVVNNKLNSSEKSWYLENFAKIMPEKDQKKKIREAPR